MIPVSILSLGGTILSRSGSAETVPLAGLRLPDQGAVDYREVARLGSNALSFADITGLAGEIADRHAADPNRAFVLVQGTDTMEETAFLLDLLLPRTVSLVVTGAMRTADALGADGPANLADAIAAARAWAARPDGVGAGTAPPPLDPLLAGVAERMPLVMATRSGQGEVAADIYVGPGTTHHLMAQGAIAGGYLDARKTRILLTVLLWAGYRGDALREELGAWRDLAL